MQVAVLGSANVDLVVRMKRLPHPGETVGGADVSRHFGGKGANQAVAAARLGCPTAFFGMVGGDTEGAELVRALRADGVDVRGVERVAGVSSGTAFVWVGEDGGNAIVSLPGANASLDVAFVERVLPLLAEADVLLLQLEVPLTVVRRVLDLLPRPGPAVVLDPSPAADLSGLRLSRVAVLTPNRTELEAITGSSAVSEGGDSLLARGVGLVVCKAGPDGAFAVDSAGVRHYSAFPVEAADATAAGDAFNGALAACLAAGTCVNEALVWATAAGALAATRLGAQPSLPTRSEVEALVRSRNLGGLRQAP